MEGRVHLIKDFDSLCAVVLETNAIWGTAQRRSYDALFAQGLPFGIAETQFRKD